VDGHSILHCMEGVLEERAGNQSTFRSIRYFT